MLNSFSGLQKFLNQQGFNVTGLSCTTCIGNSGELDESIASAISENDIVAVVALSGNRNFEGRIHPLTRANYLASPPLVVAYALASTTAGEKVLAKMDLQLAKTAFHFEKTCSISSARIRKEIMSSWHGHMMAKFREVLGEPRRIDRGRWPCVCMVSQLELQLSSTLVSVQIIHYAKSFGCNYLPSMLTSLQCFVKLRLRFQQEIATRFCT